MWIITLLPFKALYLISDFLFIIIYYVVRYRRKVVWKNLKNSFPNKTENELKKIERKFYLHFCDCFFAETMKLMHISDKEIKQHIQFTNIEIMDYYYKNNKSIILYLGHYGNWEWLPFAWNVWNKGKEHYRLYPAYYPVENKYFDQFYYNLRIKSGCKPIAQKRIFRAIVNMKRKGEKVLFAFIADQSPIWNSVEHWMTFLNQDTATINGVEKIARQTGYAVLYLSVKKIKRGYYTGEFVPMCENANELPEHKLTEQYMSLMEQTINEDPAFWLWTHKRWKFSR